MKTKNYALVALLLMPGARSGRDSRGAYNELWQNAKNLRKITTI